MSEEQKVLFVVNGQKVDGLGQVNGKAPKPSQADTPEAELRAQIAELQGQLVNANGAAQTNAEQYSKQLEYAQRIQGELDQAKTWAASLEGQLTTSSAAAASQLTAQAEQISQLQAEAETLRAQAAAPQPGAPTGTLLPDDALDRLIAVKGIAPTLAQKALDALTAPAEAPAPDPEA